MAGLYLVGAWLLTQVASTVLPMFGAPDWLPRSIVSLLAIGFVPALIFSWVFELTPQGLKRDEDVRPEESIAPQTARRMNRIIIAVLVLALGYFVFDKFVLTPRREAALVAARPSPEPKSAANAKCCKKFPACTWLRGHPLSLSKVRTRPHRKSERNWALRIWWREACARPATSCASRPDSLRPTRVKSNGRKITHAI